MSAGRIFVCVTCDRYAERPVRRETPGQQLASAMRLAAAKAGGAVAVRAVECLNGCTHPCTAALRTPGKAVLRFAGLTPDDTTALLEAATLYAESADGDLPREALAATLRGKLSGRVTMGKA